MDIDFLITITIYMLIILVIHYFLIGLEKNGKTTSIPNKKILKTNNIKNDVEFENILLDDYTTQSTQSSNTIDTNKDSELIINSNELENLNNISSRDDLMKYLDIEKKEKDEAVSSINLSNDTKSLNSYFTENNEKYNFDKVPTIDSSTDLNQLKKMSESQNSESIIFGNVLAFDDFDDNHAPVY